MGGCGGGGGGRVDLNTVQVNSTDNEVFSLIDGQSVCVPYCHVNACTSGSWLVDDAWTNPVSDLCQAEKTDRVVTEGLRCGMDGILC